MKKNLFFILLGMAIASISIALISANTKLDVNAGGKVTSPTGVAPDRYVYYPGTEELKPDEIRIIACGTGMPAVRQGRPLQLQRQGRVRKSK